IAVFTTLFLIWRRIFYEIFAAGFHKITVLISENPSPTLQEIEQYIKEYPQSGMKHGGTFSSFENFRNHFPKNTANLIITEQELPKDPRMMQFVYASHTEVLDLATACENILSRIPVTSISTTWLLHNLRNARSVVYETVITLIGFFVAAIILLLTLPFSLL